MRIRRVRGVAAALALPLVLTATACSGDDDKPADKSGSSSSAATAQSADAKALVAKLKAGVSKLRSAHFAISADVGGQKLAGAGDEKLSGGRLTALQADATLPGAGDVSIVVLGTKRYAKLPPPLATKAKPWLPITSGSDNAVVKQVAGVLDAALAAASLDGLTDVAAATTRVQDKGTSGGRTHYALTIDPTRLPAGAARTALGRKAIPAQLYVDGSGRPVRIDVRVTLLGQATDTTVTFGRFDAPVTISAPPAAQIGSG